MDTCPHAWDRIHEEALIGGSFPIGWQCRHCNKFVGQHEMGPSGLVGVQTGRNILIGPHGGISTTSTGVRYRRQIIEADGTLTIEAA